MSDDRYLRDNIKQHSAWVRHYAREMIARLSFETLAEEEMELTERELSDALRRVREARKIFARKHVEQRHAA